MKLLLSSCFAAALLLSPVEAQAQTIPPPAPSTPPATITVPDAGKFYSAALSGIQLTDTRISLDLKNASLRDAFKKAFEAAKQDYELDDDLPGDVKVTLKVEKVRLATVLDLLAQNAGAGWHTERDKSKVKIHVGKKVPQAASLYSALAGRTLSLPTGVTSFITVQPDAASLLYKYATSEQRSTFTCPHCKAQTTILQKKQQPTCPTCQRAFQPGWKVCPYDGAKRPADPAAWKFCPICGKPVSSTETAAVTTFFGYHALTPFALTNRS